MRAPCPGPPHWGLCSASPSQPASQPCGPSPPSRPQPCTHPCLPAGALGCARCLHARSLRATLRDGDAAHLKLGARRSLAAELRCAALSPALLLCSALLCAHKGRQGRRALCSLPAPPAEPHTCGWLRLLTPLCRPLPTQLLVVLLLLLLPPSKGSTTTH